VRKLIFVGVVQVLLVLGGCGGGGGSSSPASSDNGGSGDGGSSSSGANVVTMTVNDGPNGASDPDADTPFITITVCAPGSTTNCQQISNIEVDTGSYGLRIISSVLSSSVMGALTQEYASNNQPLVECTEFVDGISWGPVMQADVQIGGESANSVPIQVMGDSSFEGEIPSSCSSMGSEEDTVSAFGANGIIGVGPFAQDCGSGCVLSNASYADNPTYFACPSGGTSASDCQATGPTLEQQVTDPVADFTSTGDDNGVIVELPSVADPDGAATATGSLVFGIGTESNNGLGSATVFTGNDYGDITTNYNGNDLQFSFLDTGSNAYYFDAGNTTSLPDCPSSGGSSSSSSFKSSWLCPTSEQTINLTNEGGNGTTSSVSIKIYNADTLFNEDNGSYTAFDDLGADTGSQTTYCNDNDLTTAANGDCYFDLGLPFFFGRNVYIAIGGANTPGGEGPYFAY
jgi:hypothetical protein